MAAQHLLDELNIDADDTVRYAEEDHLNDPSEEHEVLKYTNDPDLSATLVLLNTHSYRKCEINPDTSLLTCKKNAFWRPESLWRSFDSYRKCNTDPENSLLSCSPALYNDFKMHQDDKANATFGNHMLELTKNIDAPLVFGWACFGLYLMLLVLGPVRAARVERRRTIRRLIKIHPKDRSAEVDRLATQIGMISAYDEEDNDLSFGAVVDKMIPAGGGP